VIPVARDRRIVDRFLASRRLPAVMQRHFTQRDTLNGGADYQLAGSSGTTLDARYTLAPSNGEFIIVRNCGPINGLTPVFEARTDGSFAFLTTGKFLSSAPGAGSGGVSITFYERN
jgi:uncharacterized protein DUF3237